MGIEPTVRQTCARHDVFNAYARGAAGAERRRSGLHDPPARSGLVILGPRHQSSPLKDVYEHKCTRFLTDSGLGLSSSSPTRTRSRNGPPTRRSTTMTASFSTILPRATVNPITANGGSLLCST